RFEFEFDVGDLGVDQSDTPTIVEEPHASDARVAWAGLPCNTAPTVTVTRDGPNAVMVTVDPGPEVLGPGEERAAVGVDHAVDLSFALNSIPQMSVALDEGNDS